MVHLGKFRGWVGSVVTADEHTTHARAARKEEESATFLPGRVSMCASKDKRQVMLP